jgi:hypothetical protein
MGIGLRLIKTVLGRATGANERFAQMSGSVELVSGIDWVSRRVWYRVDYLGKRSVRRSDYKYALTDAMALCQEHATTLIDRSDKGSGFLLASLGR